LWRSNKGCKNACKRENKTFPFAGRGLTRKEKIMKRNYENIEIKIVLFSNDDIIRTSNDDNVEPMPDFPEMFG